MSNNVAFAAQTFRLNAQHGRTLKIGSFLGVSLAEF
jgi:hypothetical protein